jgi:O-antigen/teichoic acid export membrane protein
MEKTQVIAGGTPHLEGEASAARLDRPMPSKASVSAPQRGRFAAHIGWTLAARLLMVANSMIASIIVARLLGAGGLGTLAVLNVAVAIASQLGSAGLPSANTYFIARNRECLAPAWANSLIFATMVGSALVVGMVGLATLRPALFGHVPPALVATAAFSIPFQLVTLPGLNIFLGLGRIASFNLLDTAAQSFILVNAIAALVIFGAGLWTLVSLNTAASALMGLTIAWMIGRLMARQTGGLRLRPDARLFRSMARYGVKFHVSVVAAMLLFRADLLIVNHFRGTTEAGVYAVASQAAMMLMLLPGVVATLLMPRAASAGDASGAFTMRATRYTAFVMLLVCLAAAPASLLLPVLYGVPFADASLLLLILLPGVYLVGIESVLVQHFNSTGLPAAIPVFWLITLVINVTLNLVFVPTFGARAAAVNSTLCYAMIFIFVVSYFRVRTGHSLSATLLLRRDELRDLLSMARAGASSR